MYIESIEYQYIVVEDERFKIIELKVRGGSLDILENFMMDIQDFYSLAYDDYVKEYNMMILTFDYIPKEQTLTQIKRYTKNYIDIIEKTKIKEK